MKENIMVKNTVARVLNIIGVAEFVLGVLAAIIVMIADADLIVVSLSLLIGCFIGGMMFIAFGQVIHLLQKNVDNQALILSQLELNSGKSGEATAAVLRDIETNLPKI